MHIKAEKSRYHRFTLYYDYAPDRVEYCRIIKDSFGWQRFSYDSSEGLKRWVFSESLFVKLLVERFPEIEVDPMVLNIVEHEEGVKIIAKKREEVAEQVKAKEDSDIKIKGIKGELYPYQKVGVEFLLASGGRAIVADQMGLGKSLQALAYAAHSGFARTLIIAPASVKSSWEKEIKKWSNLKYVIIDSKTNLAKVPADVKLWVINYDLLRKHFDTLMKTRFDLMVADECHLVKNHTAQRTKAVRALSKNIPHIVLLSGTPLLSRPVEMFTLLNMVDPQTWNNWYAYTRQYCNGHEGRWGYDTSGATNTEELHQKIKKYFIRRTKDKVLSQLPPKNHIDLPVEFDADTARKYNAAEEDLVAYLKQYAGKQPAEIARMVQAEKLAQLNVLRHLSAMGKLRAAEDIIESVLESGEKILVFCSFLEPLKALEAKFKDKVVMITGETPVGERGALVDKFQTDKNAQLFLGGIKSAGVGITLTAASNVLFLDYSWNPADHQQAEDRIHRPGQEAQSVNIYQLYVEGTIDGKLQKMLGRKRKIFDQVVEGKLAPKKGKEKDAVTEVLQDLMERKGGKFKPMNLSLGLAT